MHLVFTGRDAHPQVVELTDTVSEVIEVKHAYQKDIESQPGIDYYLRHTFASELLSAGMPLESLQILMGHSHIEVTRR